MDSRDTSGKNVVVALLNVPEEDGEGSEDGCWDVGVGSAGWGGRIDCYTADTSPSLLKPEFLVTSVLRSS
jgi:hypothetical protein